MTGPRDSAGGPPPTPGVRASMRFVRFAVLCGLLCLLQVASVVVLVASFHQPWTALAGAWTVSCAAAILIAKWRVSRARDSARRRPLVDAARLVAISTAVSLGLFMWPGVSTPDVRPDHRATRLRVAGGELAVRTIRATVQKRPPLVALHGGPGVPFTEAEERALSGLAVDRDIVIYDQIGVGDSSRLSEPHEYSLRRAVDDLGAVVAATGMPKVSILGYSWGAQVATVYAAEHPDRVAELVLMSPGFFPWQGRPLRPGLPQSRLTLPQKAYAYGLAVKPRNLFVYVLVGADPDVARWFASDAEMDARFAELFAASEPATFCDRRGRSAKPSGLGFYASQVPQQHPGLDGVTRAEVPGLGSVRTLILRGSCDYIPMSAANDYRDVMPGSRLVDVRDAGHALLEDAGPEVVATVRAFLQTPSQP
ncbi:alpha/beta hydrolase [Microtetraspora malaysiensis]|uniref:Alpha/beta hydrolase n=1 Tax=Microtetraspora malaysiensis TaxID=161358 RepID=A0ABW6SS01_9ACTN